MIYLALVILSFLLTYSIKNYAIKKSFLANVNERSLHTIPTPHGGGIAIATTWFLGLLYLYIAQSIDLSLLYALSTGAILCCVSFLDDVFELHPIVRLFFQALTACLGIYFLGGLEVISFSFFQIQNGYITSIFAFILTLWFINLYNFLDGIDGYAASEAIFLSTAGWLLFQNEIFIVFICAVVGFLYFNWHKAKIFMGDAGSTLLGYNIAILTLYYTNQESSNLWVWVILFGIFWFDATLTLLRRFKNRENVAQAHKKHAYQRLVQSGWSHSKVVLSAMGLNSILFILVFSFSNLFLAFLISIVLLYVCVLYVDRRKKF